MKRLGLIRATRRMGCVFIRPGGEHDGYQNPLTKVAQPAGCWYRYTYRVTWSEADGEHVGLCAGFPSLTPMPP